MASPPVKRALGKWFLWTHRAISLGAISLLLRHVLTATSQQARILIASSCGFWVATTAFRLLKVLYYRRIGDVIEVLGTADTVQLEVRLRQPVRLHAGAYFYVFFPFTWYPLRNTIRYNFLHSVTAIAFWHGAYDESRRVTSLRFLLSRHGSHGAAISRLREGQSILLDGPYGQNLKLEDIQNVILSAKGMGIVGILPLALDLALRRKHDDGIRGRVQQISAEDMQLHGRLQATSGEERESLSHRRQALAEERTSLSKEYLHRDSVKKVIIFWSLESNSQMEWVQKQLETLQKLDPGNVGPTLQSSMGSS